MHLSIHIDQQSRPEYDIRNKRHPTSATVFLYPCYAVVIFSTGMPLPNNNGLSRYHITVV